MRQPFVSFVFPVADDPEAIQLLRRSIGALRDQTAESGSFEVLVAVDGVFRGETMAGMVRRQANVLHALDVNTLGFVPRVSFCPRTRGQEHLPHRNHARNEGCLLALGEYLWVLDADMMPGPTAVEHLRALVERQRASGGPPIVVTPCFAEPAMTPAEWLRSSTVEGVPLRRKTGSGYHQRFRPGPPASARVPELIEGFPAVPHWLFDALGGFDERFIGYGGNKVSFVRALTLLDSQEQLLEVHLLTSCMFLHQPHERDTLRFDEAHRAENWRLFNEYVDGMKTRAPWWCKRVAAVQRAIAAEAGAR